MRFARAWMALWALGSAACVDETLVLGDDRARHACEDAALIAAPEDGCTTLTVASLGPYGCLEEGVFGTSGRDHAGSWVRISRRAEQAATVWVTLVSDGAVCTIDGGVGACPVTVSVRAFGGTPCACESGSFSTYEIPTTFEQTLDVVDEEILLEPFGATFDVSVCAGAAGP